MRLNAALQVFPRLLGEDGYLRNRGYVFLIGHMRSYSSLLGHLLGSHRQVAGYAEMHQKYRNVLDLLELAAKVEKSSGRSPANRYVFDKILHGPELPDRILLRRDLHVILSVRHPAPAIASIVALRAGGIGTVAQAVDYYLARLATIADILRRRQGRVLYLDAEAIIERPQQILAGLAAYLGLTPALGEEYSVFAHTGAPKFGDPSETIRSGRIIRQPRAHVPPELTADQRQALDAAYQSLRSVAGQSAEASFFIRPPAFGSEPAAATRTSAGWEAWPFSPSAAGGG